MQKKLLIFDFDGTIADTLSVAVEIVNELGEEFGLPQVTPEEFLTFKHKSVTELMDLAGMSWLQLPLFVKRVRDGFKSRLHEVKPIWGMPTALTNLHKQGYQMGILTSNTRENVQEFLKSHKLEYFEFVEAPGSIFGKSGAMKDILKKYKVRAKDTVMVGDEVRDVKAAKKCRVDAIAVTWGFNSEELLEKEKPAHIITKPRQLTEIFL